MPRTILYQWLSRWNMSQDYRTNCWSYWKRQVVTFVETCPNTKHRYADLSIMNITDSSFHDNKLKWKTSETHQCLKSFKLDLIFIKPPWQLQKFLSFYCNFSVLFLLWGWFLEREIKILIILDLNEVVFGICSSRVTKPSYASWRHKPSHKL